MPGLVKRKIVFTLPDVPFVQSCSAWEMVVFWTRINTPKLQSTLKMRNMRSQCTFKASTGSLTGCSKPTMKDQILNAEILQAPNIVDKNHSFSSVNVDSDKFKRMFLDLQITAKYSQEETKFKYVLSFNFMSLPLLIMNWLLMYKYLHTPLNSTKLQLPKWKSSMMDTPVFSQRIYAKL